MRKHIVIGFALLLVIALTFVCYWPGLQGPLLLDDFENLKSLADLSQGLTTWHDVLVTSSSSDLGRPITMVSFIANQLASGGEVWAYKYTNLMIHLLCGILVFWLVGRLISQEHSLSSYRWHIALWAAAIWLLAPLQVSTVLYVVQRMAQLSTLLILAGLITYVIGRQNLEHRPRLAVTLLLSVFLFWLPLAVLAKENGALLPLLALVIEAFFFRFRAPLPGWRMLIVLYSLFLLLPALTFLIQIIIDPSFILSGYRTRDFTLSERLLTEARVLFDYLRALILPYGPSLGVYHDDFLKSTSFLNPITTLPAVLAWISILIAVAFSLKTWAAPLCFGVVFYLAGHVLESSVFSLELYFEHRNYLPSVGIVISLATAMLLLVQKLPHRAVLLTLIALIPVGHAAATYQRVQTWTSWEGILLTAAQAHPHSPRVHGDLAIYYTNRKELDRALAHMEEAVRLAPDLASGAALYRIAAYCLNDRYIGDAEYRFLAEHLSSEGAITTKNTLNILRTTLATRACPQLDRDRLADILDDWLAKPSVAVNLDMVWFGRIMLGHILANGGRLTRAMEQADNAVQLYPERLESGLLKLQYHIALGDIPGARQTLLKLKEHDTGKRVDQSRTIQAFEKYLQAFDGK